ncbi:ferrous iron transport protein A [Candidatus Bipolaricaulota bacterium]
MTLEQLEFRTEARIVAIEGGHGIERRLAQMGIHVGDAIAVSSRGAFRGPLLVTIHGARIALGRGVAGRIVVEPTSRKPLREGDGT